MNPRIARGPARRTGGSPTRLPRPLVFLPAVRPILLACVVAVIMPACAPEGAGSIHINRSRISSVMVTPDRKSHMPSQTKARGGRPIPKSNLPRR
jgi:hypothetical protein